MARTTISIPDDIKAKMDQVEEPVNWSGLAAAAFRSKLSELAGRRRTEDLQGVVERLRASRLLEGTGRLRAGHEAGTRWGSGAASVSQLRRLEAAFHPDVITIQDWVAEYQAGSYAYRLGECLAFVIDPDRDGDQGAAAEFWREALRDAGDVTPDLVDDPEWVIGFVEGARDLWRRVQPLL